MRGKWLIPAALTLIAACDEPVTLDNDPILFANPDPRDAGQVALGKDVYGESCSGCHGIDLEGEYEWQTRKPSGLMPAPPHDATGHSWHHPDAQLLAITKYGTEAVVGTGFESDMPGFEETLTDAEIVAVLAFIKTSWGPRERRTQARSSQAWRDARAQD